MSGVPLSVATIASGGSYATSGQVTPPDSTVTYQWLGTATGMLTPGGGALLVGNGPMSKQITVAGGSASFQSVVLAAAGVPDGAAGLDISGAPGATLPGSTVSDAITYRFDTSTLPAGAGLVLWETGTDLGTLTAQFSFTAADGNAPVGTTGWTYTPVAPFTATSGAQIGHGNGTVDITQPIGPLSDPQAVVLVTPGVPITAVTVRAVTSAADTWGLAFTGYSTAQNELPCFVAGSAILTPDGPVPVERLAPGDAVLTRFAGVARVVWTGRRRLAPARHAQPDTVWPFRIRRDAVAPGVPARDLLLSPDHAVFLGGALIPVKYLANGFSVVQDRSAETVEYWHVELARHDVLLAEALPVESYLDTGNRAAFERAGAVVALHPDFTCRTWEGDACAALWGEGPPVDHVRALLLARARMLHRAEAGPGSIATWEGHET